MAPKNTTKIKHWWVYIVRCSDGTLYCGSTNDLKKRIIAHNTGKGARYTRGRNPVALAYRKRCPSKSAAFCEEARIKRLPRPRKMRLLFSLDSKDRAGIKSRTI